MQSSTCTTSGACFCPFALFHFISSEITKTFTYSLNLNPFLHLLSSACTALGLTVYPSLLQYYRYQVRVSLAWFCFIHTISSLNCTYFQILFCCLLLILTISSVSFTAPIPIYIYLLKSFNFISICYTFNSKYALFSLSYCLRYSLL